MNNFNDSFKKVIEFSFSNKSSSHNASKEFLKEFSSDKIQIFDLEENKIFIESNNKLDYIYILVNGMTYIVYYTVDGRRIIADTLNGVQIFGLIEAVNNTSCYSGTVITLSKSLLVKIKKEYFLEAIYNDIHIASYIIKYLAAFSTHSIKASEYKTSISPYENLIIYLYNKTIKKNLPCKIKDNKTFIADSLHINKRTLYRYLNRLTDDDIISRDRQDIVITENNYKKIQRIFNSINNI